MKITVVCDVLGEENNGTTTAAMNLIRSLEARGHDVTVVTADPNSEEHRYCLMPKLNLGPLNIILRNNGVSLARADKEKLRKALADADAVHIMLPFFLGGRAARMAQEMGKPITAGFHCQAENFTNQILMMNSKFANHFFYRLIDWSLYRYTDAIHYPTQFICDVFEKERGRVTNHYVISNGVNSAFVPQRTEKPAELEGKFVILFSGRYSREKSHPILLRAVAKSKHREEIRLVFAGKGPFGDRYLKMAKKLGIAPPVLGFYTREELIRVINYSDLYVHPAEIEIEAISCLEAISCGKVPVINNSPRSATRFFALDERNLFDFNDDEALAERIDYWIEHPEKREACSEAYRGYAKQFAFDQCMDQMEHMILKTKEEKEEKDKLPAEVYA